MPLTNPFDFDFVIHPYIVSVMRTALFHSSLIYKDEFHGIKIFRHF